MKLGPSTNLGRDPQMLGDAAVAHPKQQNIPRRLSPSVGFRRNQRQAASSNIFPPAGLRPILRIGWHCLRFRSNHRHAKPPQQTKTIGPRPLQLRIDAGKACRSSARASATTCALNAVIAKGSRHHSHPKRMGKSSANLHPEYAENHENSESC